MVAKGVQSLRDSVMREAHARLIADHCTAKKRAYVDGILTYGEPPSYADVVDANIVNAELCAPNIVNVDANCKLKIYRFVVQKKRDGWRIDSIKWKLIETDKWENGLIGM